MSTIPSTFNKVQGQSSGGGEQRQSGFFFCFFLRNLFDKAAFAAIPKTVGKDLGKRQSCENIKVKNIRAPKYSTKYVHT